jgi:L-amino acid N-acyltransferase YncA
MPMDEPLYGWSDKKACVKLKGSVMTMQIKLRKAVETDWPAILEVANAAVPESPRENQQWLSNRMRFDQTGYIRRHYVALEAATGKVIGYGAIEGGKEAGRYRLFVVTSPDQLATGAGDLLYNQLIADLSTLNASAIWARESAHDALLLNFLSQHGFHETGRFQLPDGGVEVVVMERKLE